MSVRWSGAVRWAAGILAGGLAAAASVGCVFGPKSNSLPMAGGTRSVRCAECHRAIYDEWRESAHAAAFVREEFRLATRQHQEKDCLRCHVPASLDRVSEAPVRTVHQEEGVNCEACHLAGDAYAAPEVFSSHSEHKTVVRPILAKSEFCGKCHEAIFKQWAEAAVERDQRKSCQQCHMPSVRRKTVSGSLWHMLHPKADTRRHHFAMVEPQEGKPNVTVQVAIVQATAEAVVGRATLTNVAAQHSLPSGEFGFRELALVVSLVDRYGVASAKQVERFLAQKKRYLHYGKPQAVEFRFDRVPRDVEALDVRLIRSSFSGVEVVLHSERRKLRLWRRPSPAVPEASEK